MIKIVVTGDAVPAARPRFNGHAYQPKRNMEYRARVKNAAYSAMAGREPMTGAVAVCVRLYRRYKPTTKQFGDADNHLKAILDGLNQIAFKDDSQICRCLVEKFKDAENPRAEIEIEELGSDNDVKS